MKINVTYFSFPLSSRLIKKKPLLLLSPPLSPLHLMKKYYEFMMKPVFQSPTVTRIFPWRSNVSLQRRFRLYCYNRRMGVEGVFRLIFSFLFFSFFFFLIIAVFLPFPSLPFPSLSPSPPHSDFSIIIFPAVYVC
eukprot:TRINITY_DN4223_c0_g1_i1.p1 TRINITY_DN4223_c0_g1~~TRINITY_DN4223_c0_g1_i1.p1  ORF type:complete len:135 (+),score=0.25 TRINITY_DN4223_c0_g1_i1:219-623(+)